MKYSDYMYLAGRLAFLTREADRTRALLTMPVFVTPGENGRNAPIVATVDPGQGEAVEIPVNRTGIGLAVVRVDNDIAGLMDGLVDGYVDANQDRADQGRGATAGFHALFQAMAGFMEATNMPVEGFGPFYPKIRERAGKWIELATTWFPDLNDNEAPKKVAVPAPAIDRDKLKKLFNFKFTEPTKGSDPQHPLPVPFDLFCNTIYSCSVDYTPTDYGRIAYQVRRSKYLNKPYKEDRMPFSKFLRIFCDACGVNVPKDTAPSRYKDLDPDYSVYL